MSAPNDTDDHALLVQFLHDRDVECPVCKYNLRMLTSPLPGMRAGFETRTVGTLAAFPNPKPQTPNPKPQTPNLEKGFWHNDNT